MRKIPFEELSDVPLIKEYWEELLEMPIPDKQEYWDKPDLPKETLNIEEIKKIIDE